METYKYNIDGKIYSSVDEIKKAGFNVVGELKGVPYSWLGGVKYPDIEGYVVNDNDRSVSDDNIIKFINLND